MYERANTYIELTVAVAYKYENEKITKNQW